MQLTHADRANALDKAHYAQKEFTQGPQMQGGKAWSSTRQATLPTEGDPLRREADDTGVMDAAYSGPREQLLCAERSFPWHAVRSARRGQAPMTASICVNDQGTVEAG